MNKYQKYWVSGDVRDGIINVIRKRRFIREWTDLNLYVGTRIEIDTTQSMPPITDTSCILKDMDGLSESILEKFYTSKFMKNQPDELIVYLLKYTYSYSSIDSNKYKYEVHEYQNVNKYVEFLLHEGGRRTLRTYDLSFLAAYCVTVGDLELFLEIAINMANANNYEFLNLSLFLNNKEIPFDENMLDDYFSDNMRLFDLISLGITSSLNTLTFLTMIMMRYDNKNLKDIYVKHFSKTKTLESANDLKRSVNNTISKYGELIDKKELINFISETIIHSILNKKFRTKENTVPKLDIEYVSYLICNFDYLTKEEILGLIEKYQLSYSSIFKRILSGTTSHRVNLLKNLGIIKGDSTMLMRSYISSLFHYSPNDWEFSYLPIYITSDNLINYFILSYLNLNEEDRNDIREFLVYYLDFIFSKGYNSTMSILNNLDLFIDGDSEKNDIILGLVVDALYINYDRNLNIVSKILFKDGIDLTSNVLSDVKYKEFKKHYIKSLI